ncbi:MAG: type IV toxin-antitoxin system AbiEi family antitoxin domain-containing protein [Proteobacteria bacterium]|nr:type IV toxin-antitoxin system AbiEi family antitoxin domain-containing protein [Pseudomonadota bacterium]
MDILTGIGKADRERMAAIIRNTKGTISVPDAAGILNVSASDAAKMLSRWSKNGWMSRVRRGLYVAVPLESSTTDVPLEDPWLIADRLFSPCYIGGWSAAEYFDLTEQIFSTIVVMTVQKPRDRRPDIKGTKFLLRTIPEKALFGLKPVWRGQVKIWVSDPARTLLDLLVEPLFGGGIRSVSDMLATFLRSENKNLECLIGYGEKLGNGSVFKRLGFLLEKMAPDETRAIEECRIRMTAGNARLDPKLNNSRLVTRWRLWVPENWKEKQFFD